MFSMWIYKIYCKLEGFILIFSSVLCSQWRTHRQGRKCGTARCQSIKVRIWNWIPKPSGAETCLLQFLPVQDIHDQNPDLSAQGYIHLPETDSE